MKLWVGFKQKNVYNRMVKYGSAKLGYDIMKNEKDEWTKKEMIGTAFSTIHEWHATASAFSAGLSEGSKYVLDDEFKDEKAYYSFGWSLGELVDRFTNDKKEDTKFALAQFAGILLKYGIIALTSIGIFDFIL